MAKVMLSRTLEACGLLMLAGVAVVAAASAEPKGAAVRAYERGARELEFGRFEAAGKAFAEAIALDPVESRQPAARTSGMNFEPYLPHLALGLSLCEVGELRGAAASWAESERQAVAQGAASARRLLALQAECSNRRSAEAKQALAAAIVSVESDLAAAGANVRAPEKEALRARLGDLAALSRKPVPEIRFARWIEALVEADRLLLEVRSIAARPSASADTATPEAGAPAGSRRLGEPVADAATEIPQPVADPSAAVEPPAKATLPPRLLRAAQELFDGRPAAAYAMLEGFSSERPRSRAQGHLLRAAAGFDLARLEPVSAALWISRAKSERIAARREAPGLLPDRAYFAPAFVEFFTTGASPRPLPDLLGR